MEDVANAYVVTFWYAHLSVFCESRRWRNGSYRFLSLPNPAVHAGASR